MLQGYGQFINSLDRICVKNEKSDSKTDNSILLSRIFFWNHLTNLCTKLHRQSRSDQQALKCLQVLLSSMNEPLKGKTVNSLPNINSKKNNSRKLRFEGTGSEATEEKEMSTFEQVLILSKKHLEKIASATLGRLDDASDAVVTSKIWDTSLYLVSKYKVFIDFRTLILLYL